MLITLLRGPETTWLKTNEYESSRVELTQELNFREDIDCYADALESVLLAAANKEGSPMEIWIPKVKPAGRKRDHDQKLMSFVIPTNQQFHKKNVISNRHN